MGGRADEHGHEHGTVLWHGEQWGGCDDGVPPVRSPGEQRSLRPRAMSYQDLAETGQVQQMQQAVVNSLQADFEEAQGRHSTASGIAASLPALSMAPEEGGADAFKAMDAIGRANAVSGVARRQRPAAGLSVDSEEMGGLHGGEAEGSRSAAGPRVDGRRRMKVIRPQARMMECGGGTNALGDARMLGSVGQAGEGAEWAGDDVRGKGEGLCVTIVFRIWIRLRRGMPMAFQGGLVYGIGVVVGRIGRRLRREHWTQLPTNTARHYSTASPAV